MLNEQRWSVALLGARMHYAVPRILHNAGILEHLFTDICAVKGWPRLLNFVPGKLQSDGVKRLLGRVPDGIPPEHITAFNQLGWSYAQRLRQASNRAEITAAFLWAGKKFCDLVLKTGLGSATGIYTFNSAGLEILQSARQQDMQTVMEQTIAPRSLEYQLLQAEQEFFPDWEIPLSADPYLEEYIWREEQEWMQSDMILCGSEFVREAIKVCGGPSDRCRVVPYGVDISIIPEKKQISQPSPLRVLTVGSISLRKGSPYVLEAARQLRGKVEFRMVGTVNIKTEAQSQLNDYIQLTGPIPRIEILSQYAWADVFLLPSLCEGSATVTYEALAAGLPVICTTNTGSVVRDGIDGFIVPIRNSLAIMEKLELLALNPELRDQMAQNARQRAWEFTLKSYHQRLMDILVPEAV
ncbi:glycosyltransferase family 4 protein [Nodularia spumigena]|uniref:Alpha-D-kanosaminyltransferase n=2 Tax=Nodularia spumigena TaxID=70799 RepID=A0A2S0QB40_NODSP|nr:glycosyltransferase family 4 protein [Nodularia spumigena]AVZ31591.1 alpha-D-kanosaminyltransferase [Nodularia spumigena UHCC 0039]MEA5526346.1 glycosyltransferase family 4 protein [Nodularia spumigena UHCC 0143]MEA5611094.1 glycosyltransferase family 4 protein [Nodularia spumigena UHCC 0060]MEA5612875.1 glycosyltransferase family 4 protein [Nodularia spumigena UHCC 0040]